MSAIKKIVETTRKHGKARVGMDDKAWFLVYAVGMTLWAVVIGALALGVI